MAFYNSTYNSSCIQVISGYRIFIKKSLNIQFTDLINSKCVLSGVAYPEFLGKFNTDQSKYFNDANLLITVKGIAQSTITMVDLNDDCQL